MNWTNLPRRRCDRSRASWTGLLVFAAMGVLRLAPEVNAGVANAPKVYVFPFQSVFEGAPTEITVQVGDLLKKEIKQNDELKLQKGPIFIPEGKATRLALPDEKDLANAEQLKKSGEGHYQKLQLEKAVKALRAALGKYEKGLAILSDLSPVVEPALRLSIWY